MKMNTVHDSAIARTVALFLTAIMLFGILLGAGVCAYAEGEEVININSQEEFETFVNDVNNNKNLYTGKTVNLICDVNTKVPIGTTSVKFAGSFDGNGHTITAAISGTTYQGLFAYNNGTIKNLILEGTVSGSMYSGGIAGYNNGTIDSCINNAKCNFTGSYVGGIAGFNGKTGNISNCINNGVITTNTSGGFCGGIVGSNSGAIANCYNTGEIGKSTKSFAIVGSGVGTVTNCYFLKDSASDAKATEKTDEELKSADIVATLGDAYAKNPEGGYPMLKWQVNEGGEPHEHVWNDGVVTTPATCTEAGVMTFTCSTCGETKTEKIAALGHEFKNGTCSRCGEKQKNPFVDVPNDSVYCDAILWAYYHSPEQITTGTDATHFSPQDTSTRAQVVTFLWRAAGCPEPNGKVNPFVDVSNEGSCKPYYKAILWAAEKGITLGVDSTHFEPGTSVTRAQFLTFLWRYEKSPKSAASIDQFKDAASIAKPYQSAVAWGVEKKITVGYEDGTFRPNDTCTRWAVALFLYRDLGNSK